MYWIKNSHFVGYFGDIADNLQSNNQYHADNFLCLTQKMKENTGMNIDCLYFPKQIHTDEVISIDRESVLKKPLHLLVEQADAVITQEKNIAIGVATADCLPIFLFDQQNKAIGVIHAGWRGLAANIISATILKMQHDYGTYPQHILVYLGPAASVCCYEVQTDFFAHFSEHDLEACIEKRDEKWFFNPKNAAIQELLEQGVLPNHIDTKSSVCTICNEQYCSVRRQKEQAGRQPSVILLHTR